MASRVWERGKNHRSTPSWRATSTRFTSAAQSRLPITGFSTTNLANLALAPAGTPPFSTRYGNLAPRFGGAYRLLTDPDWGLVLRAGFGVFYGVSDTEIFNLNYWQELYPVGAVNYLSNVAFPTTPANAALPVVQAPNIENGEILFAVDPHLNVPHALEWNVALEQSMGKAQTVALTYVGASDKRLPASEYVTNPNPNFASAYLIANQGTSNYQSLQARFQRRLTNGLQALVSYAWSHSIDTGSYGQYTSLGLGQINANRGDSDYDIRNSFSAAMTYTIPLLCETMETSDRPFVFHCSAGRDRTGIMAAILLRILGVSKAAIVSDYLLSTRYPEDRPIVAATKEVEH